MLDEISFNPVIAKAVRSARLQQISDVRVAAEDQFGPVSDSTWEWIRADWERHMALDDEDLDRVIARMS
jgi:hypothetical protein